MLWHGWTGSQFGLSRLDGGFLIRTDHPDPLFEQGSGVFIQAQDRAGPLQEGFGLLNVLPGMEPPGTDLLGGEPTADGSGRNGRPGWNRCYMTSQFGSTPMS